MEKYARQALAEGCKHSDDLVVTPDSELFRHLNLHYNRNNQVEVSLSVFLLLFLFYNLQAANWTLQTKRPSPQDKGRANVPRTCQDTPQTSEHTQQTCTICMDHRSQVWPPREKHGGENLPTKTSC